MNMHSTPAPAVLLPGFSREQIGAAIEVLIALLDATDPDPEAEEIPIEDCMIAYSDFEDVTPVELAMFDDGDDEDDGNAEPDADSFGDPSWTEWHTRGDDTLDDGITGRGDAAHEDAEESDDAGEPANEDYPDGFSQFKGDPGPGCELSDSGVFPVYQDDQSEPDPMEAFADRRLFAPHRDRIRRERCIELPRRDERGRTHRLFPLWDGGNV